MRAFLRGCLFLFPLTLCLLQTVRVAGAATEKLESAELFKRVSPGVVLLISKQTLGSGSIVNETDILTNWHVVMRSDRILVAFKPREEGVRVNPDDLVVGDVIKTDPDKDLALVRVKRVPASVRPIQLGSMDELEIGADVHAIGHPQGGQWTYTKGVISQLRKDYEWLRFKADVIQTQTPINPGNSGGPLLSDRGRLVGVNSFKAKGAEGLNFAIALNEIARFLRDVPTSSARPAGPKASERPARPKSAAKTATGLIYQGRDQDNTGYLRVYAAERDVFLSYYYPDDQTRPACYFRTTGGVTDVAIMDMNRDGKWDYSILDRDRNGKFESVGLHPDGKMSPSSYLSLTDRKVPPKVRRASPKRLPEQGESAAGSPSFDCTRADTRIEQTICGSGTLADLDVTVSTLYERILQTKPAMQGQITAGQQEWRNGTERMCREGDAARCLEDRYKQRAIYLNILMLE